MKAVLLVLALAAFSQGVFAETSCSAEWSSGNLVQRAPEPGIQLGVLKKGFNSVEGTDRIVEFQSLGNRFEVTLHSEQAPELASIDFHEGLSSPTKFILSFKNSMGNKESLFISCTNK
jgi:hypothetical protein